MEKNIQATYDHWLKLLICIFVVAEYMNTPAHGANVSITHLDSAVPKGAVCLDGSPPAYYYGKGFGEGARNWIVYLQGGGWCGSTQFCETQAIAKSTYNTSTRPTSKSLQDILSENSTSNPDFYNWNRVEVVYCDCSSFFGDVEEVDATGKNFTITRRGARIFDAVMEDLLAKGMRDADNAILTGGSAGGLATLLHCDMFADLVRSANRVKCISDSGFFVYGKDLPGLASRRHQFSTMIEYHGVAEFLPTSCASEPDLCIFPEFLVRNIRTPIFFLESAFDSYQMQFVKPSFPANSIDNTTWPACRNEIVLCTPNQLQVMKDYRATLISSIQAINSSSDGWFVHSCYNHGHFNMGGFWNDGSPVLNHKTIAQAIGDWYFDRSGLRAIDLQIETPVNCSARA